MAAESSSVATTFGVQIALAIIVFLVFSWLRLASWARRFYAPKRYDKGLECKPPRLPPGMFSWMLFIFSYPETDLIRVCGLDSAMYIRVLKFAWECFIKITLWSCIVILPINLTGDQVENLMAAQSQPPPPTPPPPPANCGHEVDTEVTAKNYAFSSFDRCSLANVASGELKLWAHMISCYVVTYIVLTALWRYNKEATLMRIAFLANSPRGGPSHTVLVMDIPGNKYGTLVWYLRELVGSTLFVMLPKSWRKRILDKVEEAFGKVSELDVAAIARGADLTIEREEDRHRGTTPSPSSAQTPALEDGTKAKPSKGKATAVTSPLTAAAALNTKAAEAVEAQKKTRATGSLLRKRVYSKEVKPNDDKLDPWKQAEAVLGDAAAPNAGAVQDFIHGEMEFCYGRGCVASVNPVWDQSELEGLLDDYTKTKQLLEDYLDKLAYDLRRRKPIKKRLQVTVIGPTLGAWGIKNYGVKPVKVDAITFWSDRLRQLADQIHVSQANCLQRPVPSAFVTFQTRATQVVLATNLHHHDETTWQATLAPEPKEIIWRNLRMRAWERTLRTMVLWGAYVALVLFFIIPVGIVQALIEVPRLASVPVLGTIVNLPVIKQVLEGIVPGLVLLIFLALLPSLLAFMCRLSGCVSNSAVDFGVVERYFYFQVLTIFLGSIISGSLLSQLKLLQSNPGAIIRILGVGIPQTATFFINFILVAGIGKAGIKHLRLPGLVIFWLLSKMASTPRARARLWADQYTTYGPNVPGYTIAFLLGLVYCNINPIIAPVVLLYMTFSVISERYNDLYVFKRTYESGGRLWLYAFNQFIICVYIMQVAMLVLLSIKGFQWVPLLIPAPFITLAFHVSCLVLFNRPWTVMSAHDAAMLDLKDATDRGDEAMSQAELQEIKQMYQSPVFKVHKADIDDLLREAAITSRRINGGGKPGGH
ncbi:hypothetical protein V8C86DRAFT_1039267 [Haematococcus lacustris]